MRYDTLYTFTCSLLSKVRSNSRIVSFDSKRGLMRLEMCNNNDKHAIIT